MYLLQWLYKHTVLTWRQNRNVLLVPKEGLNCAGNISSSTASAGWDAGGISCFEAQVQQLYWAEMG